MVGHLFRDVVQPSIKVGDRRGYTVPLSIAAHALLIAAVIIVPLVTPDSSILPMPSAMFAFVTAADPPAPPAAPPRVAVAQDPVPVANPGVAPLDAPPDITPEPPIHATGALLNGLENATGAVPGGGFEHSAAPPPPPPLAASAATPAPVRPGGDIQRPTKIKDVPPVYPRIAQATHVQGVVIIEATIGPTGKVQDARILRSIPLLDAAALEAVRQWEYTPTLLNGVPVPVLMTVTISFTLH
jgi:periplasmic protein TonB